ncbi:Hypothetical protein GLP15_1555 [Giardia lamblia P15]|uniref:Uncharacterized protein n=1 Tax=Giardia intestinalis (strain P15) TaxID=658858 RepID=E1EXJ3_GIAIA|nr:Hypothetical protein GLP15_1555 [Giardia lamblia P15]
MPRPYDPDLLNAILSTLPTGAKISKIYYLPSLSSGDNYDQIPVLLPKWKANEILRWIESEANKLTTKADTRFGKSLVRETKRTRPTFIDPTDLHTSTNATDMKTGSLPRNTFTAPDSLD